MATTITIEVPDDLTPDQAEALRHALRVHSENISTGSTLGAEMDHHISILGRLNACNPRAPLPLDLARDQFRLALREMHSPLLMASSCWMHMVGEGADLAAEVDAVAEQYPSIDAHREIIEATLSVRG